MSQTIIRIGSEDQQWHARFFRHAAAAFEGIDFSRWRKLEGWRDRYFVLALVEEEQILATIGVTLMRFSVPGEAPGSPRRFVEGFQLGAVATRNDRRGEGHAARLLDHILGVAGDAPMLLFANPSVVALYPKFGFIRIVPQRISAAVNVHPVKGSHRRFDENNAGDRALLWYLTSSMAGHAGALSARPEPSILLWYLANGFATAYVLNEERSIAFVDAADDRLILRDWIGVPPTDLACSLGAFTCRPVGKVEFGFVPVGSWLSVPLQVEPAPDVLMFWRGHSLPQGEHLCFPELLTT